MVIKIVQIGFLMMNEVTTVMYHYVRNIKGTKSEGIKGLELQSFNRQLDYLSSKFTIVDPHKMLSYFEDGVPIPKNSCILTFDDGYVDHYLFVLPELLKRKIKGAFFPPANAIQNREMLDVNKVHHILARCNNLEDLITNFENLMNDQGVNKDLIDYFKSKFMYAGKYDSPEIVYLKQTMQHGLEKKVRSSIVDSLFKKYVGLDQKEFAECLYMSIEQVKDLVESEMLVGSHGFNHVWLEHSTYEEQLLEISLSVSFLKLIGISSDRWVMCYPYGSYNSDTVDILKNNHCSCAFIDSGGKTIFSKQNQYSLRRYDTNEFPQ